jgi:hypothetical protein
MGGRGRRHERIARFVQLGEQFPQGLRGIVAGALQHI